MESVPDPINRVIVVRSTEVSGIVFQVLSHPGGRRDHAVGHLPMDCMRRVSTRNDGFPYSFISDDGTTNVMVLIDEGDTRMQLHAIQLIDNRLKPSTLILVDPAFTTIDMQQRHVQMKGHWALARDPVELYRLLGAGGGAGRDPPRWFDHVFPNYRRPVAPAEAAPVNVGREELVQYPLMRGSAEAILASRDDLSPDDLAAIQDALAANEREAVAGGMGRFMGGAREGGGGGAFMAPPPDEERDRGYGFAEWLDNADAEAIADGFGDEGGYAARLNELARGQVAAAAMRQPPMVVVNNHFGVGDGPEGAAIARVFSEQHQRDNLLRQNAGPRRTAAARRGQIGSVARQRLTANRTRNEIVQVVRKPESKKMMAVREEAPDIEPMAISADDNTCMVCMGAHITTMALPCEHYLFCNKCITTWLKKSKKCPSCNAAVECIVQPRGKHNAQDEYKRRKKDPAHVSRIADDLQRDVEALREEAKKISSAPPPPPLKQEQEGMVEVPIPPSSRPSPQVSLPSLPFRQDARGGDDDEDDEHGVISIPDEEDDFDAIERELMEMDGFIDDEDDEEAEMIYEDDEDIEQEEEEEDDEDEEVVAVRRRPLPPPPQAAVAAAKRRKPVSTNAAVVAVQRKKPKTETTPKKTAPPVKKQQKKAKKMQEKKKRAAPRPPTATAPAPPKRKKGPSGGKH